MNRIALFAVLAPLALAGCSAESSTQSASTPRGPAVNVTGPAEDCIQIYQFHETKVRDDRTVDFMINNTKGWRNTLPNSCPGLNAANAFSYETSLSQLCSSDIIHVLNNYGGRLQRGAGCGLGQFVPVEFVK